MRKVCWLVWRFWCRLAVPLGSRWRQLRVHARGVRFGKGLIVEPHAVIDGAGEVELGDNVRIGRDNIVAPYCHIADVNHGTRPGIPMRTQPLESRPADMGADV